MPDSRDSLEAQIRRFEALLAGDFIDLSHLSREIHSRPDLEKLACQFASALDLTDEGCPPTAEHSLVLLGSSRLRALIYAWFMLASSRSSIATVDGVFENWHAGSPDAHSNEGVGLGHRIAARAVAESSENMFGDLLSLAERRTWNTSRGVTWKTGQTPRKTAPRRHVRSVRHRP